MHNNIDFINNRQGDRLEVHEDVEHEFKDYFQDILCEPPGDRNQAIHSVTQHIPKIITAKHNNMLLRPVTLQEVEEEMALLKDGKALGSDGFTTNFFHAFWEQIKTKV